MSEAVCPCCGSVVDRSALPDEVELAEAMDRLRIDKRTTALLFLILWRAGGRTLTHDTIMDQVDRLNGRETTESGLRTAKKHLAKAVADYPVQIKSRWGIGYRMIRQDPSWDWRDLPIT